MAVCEPESQGLTAAEAFAEAVVKRASAALSKRATRRDVFYIGSIPFELVTPGERADEWLGRAFLQCDESPIDADIAPHRLVAWDGTDADALPPPRPWLPKAIEPRGVVDSHSNDAVRCAVDADISSLIVYNFAENMSYNWLPNFLELPLVARTSPFRIAAINPDATVAIKAWEEWAAEARLEEAPYSELRLLPAVYAHLSRIAPSLSLPNELRGKARSTFTLNRLLAHESLPIVHEMSRQTQVLLTKGIAMCVRFNAWSSRLMGDIDIYVSTAALEKVCEFLAQSGWTPHYGMTWASLVHRSSLRRNSWNLTKGNAQLDLHWRLMYADGTAEDWLTRNMWETAQPTELLGLRLLTQSPEFALITSLDHGFNFGTRADAVQTVIDATSLLPACRSDQLIHLLEKADLGDPLRQVASTLEKAGLYKMVSDIAEKYRGVLGKTVGETDLKRRRGLSLARSKPEKVVLRRPALYLLWQALGRKAWVERLLLRLNGPLSKPLAWSGTFREDYDLRECSDMDQIAGPGWGWPEPGRTCFWSDRADARLLIPLLHMGDHLIVLGLAENRLGRPNGYVRIFLNGIFWGAINVKERCLFPNIASLFQGAFFLDHTSKFPFGRSPIEAS
ncbi:MAG TPA: nucleotidyltransferase family protein [Terriglobales bacterium]|nr:nucleotidyltransferase family protein [Terriglobales bacterium]